MQSHTEKVIPATLIAGDGIGPEIVEATVMVLDAMHAPFAWEAHKAGMSGVEAFGDPLTYRADQKGRARFPRLQICSMLQ